MKNINEIISSTKELLDSSHDLIHTLAQADYDVDINDFSNIKVFSERLDQFWACTLVYSDFSCLIDDLELEKDRFFSTKSRKIFYRQLSYSNRYHAPYFPKLELSRLSLS